MSGNGLGSWSLENESIKKQLVERNTKTAKASNWESSCWR